MDPSESPLPANGLLHRSCQWTLIVGAIGMKLLLISLLFAAFQEPHKPQNPQFQSEDLAALHSLRRLLSLDSIPYSPWKDSENPCSWYGVTCSPQKNRVVALRFKGLSFSSELRVDLSAMTALKILDLSQCGFVGALPKFPSSLEELQAGGNDFDTCAEATQQSMVITSCQIKLKDKQSDMGCDYFWYTAYGVCHVLRRSGRDLWDIRQEFTGSMPMGGPPTETIPFMNPPTGSSPSAEPVYQPAPSMMPPTWEPVVSPPSENPPTWVPIVTPSYTPVEGPSWVPTPSYVPFQGPSWVPITSPGQDVPVGHPPSFGGPEPSPAPESESSPLAPTPSLAPTQTGSLSCGPPPSPSDGFVCNTTTGQWVFVGDLVGDVIILGSTAVVDGNVTVDSVVFNGENAVLIVKGCAKLKSIEIVLTQEQLEKIKNDPKERERLLLQASNAAGCPSVESVPVKVTTPKSCIKATSKTQTGTNVNTDSKTLTALFQINSTKCNLWWIILLAVLGFILLALLVFVLVATFNERVKKKVRPFWIRAQSARMTSV